MDIEKENNASKALGAQGQQGRSSTVLNVIMERSKTPGLGRFWELLAAVQAPGKAGGTDLGSTSVLGAHKNGQKPV